MIFKNNFFIFIICVSSLCLSEISGDESVEELFEKFKEDFRKIYKTATEEETRFRIFEKNVALITKHNQEESSSTYSLGITKYTDMEFEEFHELMYGTYEKDDDMSIIKVNYKPQKDVSVPESMDWREKGAVTPAKGQKRCGSCWAFSATGALEGHQFLKTGELQSLSEQNLIDCTSNDFGCRGGQIDNAFQYVINNGGIATEASYPYQAIQNPVCLFNSSTIGATCQGFVVLPPNDEEIMTEAVGTIGPISIAFNKKCLYLPFYKHGIFNQPGCDTHDLSHAMLIVGYGRDNETLQDFWIVKNSWGPAWGMDGFVKIPRFVNYGGISRRPSYPIL